MPLFASIDVGSNTIRLLIAEVKDKRIIDVYYGRKITRLGTGISHTGKLLDKNIEASIAVLKEFSSIISKHDVKRVRAVATSALREASNSDIFIEKVFADTGISIEVISGEKEAELILKGILSYFQLAKQESPPLSPPCQGGVVGGYHCQEGEPGGMFILDMGGGSTEWILYRKGSPGDRTRPQVEMGSIPIGVIKLAGSFIKTDPVSEADIKNLNDEIVLYINDLKARIGNHINSDTRFIGTAGTFSTIASVDLGLETYSREKIHLHSLPLSRLQDMSRRLLSLMLEERKNVRGLEPERADLIIPGLQFTIKVMEFFDFDELTVSDYGLLEGVLFDIFSGVRHGGKETHGKNIAQTGKP